MVVFVMLPVPLVSQMYYNSDIYLIEICYEIMLFTLVVLYALINKL